MTTNADPGPRLGDFELIVFDWDGTLMDSEARIIASMQSAFAELGREPPAGTAVREVIGLGLSEAIRQLPGVSADEPLDALIERYRHHYLAANSTPAPLFEGASELIQALDQRGRLLAVATGKSRRGLEQSLEQSGLRAHFHATRCAEESFSKPNPAMLFELMDELGAAAESTLMIGDTEYDMQMARNARVRAVAVGYGTHAPERLLAHAPLACAPSLPMLSQWLLQ